MTGMKRILVLAVATLTLALASIPQAEAQRRGGWGPRGARPSAVVRGPAFHAPRYGYRGYGYRNYGYRNYGYRRGWRGGNAVGAVGAGLLGAAVIGSIIAAQQPQCYRELAGYDRRGRPFYHDICN